jgi:hypothetical protein
VLAVPNPYALTASVNRLSEGLPGIRATTYGHNWVYSPSSAHLESTRLRVKDRVLSSPLMPMRVRLIATRGSAAKVTDAADMVAAVLLERDVPRKDWLTVRAWVRAVHRRRRTRRPLLRAGR